jgi:hypothetical protein
LEPSVVADLDTLLTALYVELTDRIIPSRGLARCGPGKPPDVTDAELVCLAVAQVLLRYDDERHWLRAAPRRVGHLFPRLLGQSEYNERVKALAPLMEAALRWLADHTPGSAELLRLMDATPVPCGQSAVTARRSDLYGWAGYGYCPSHSRWYWGAKLMLICTCDGTVTGFGLANPKLFGERGQARQMLKDQPANRPAPGTAVVTDKGLSGEETEEYFASPGLDLALIRPARKDETTPRPFPNWLRQRIEAIIWTLKHQLGLERHGGRVPAGLWARIVQRLLALNAAIWHKCSPRPPPACGSRGAARPAPCARRWSGAVLPGAFIPPCLPDLFAHRGLGQIEVPRNLANGPVPALDCSTISALNIGMNERRRWGFFLPMLSDDRTFFRGRPLMMDVRQSG